MSLTDAMTKIAALAEPTANMNAPLASQAAAGAQIFISYAARDHVLADGLDNDLLTHGYSTWWAAHLRPGEAQQKAIIAALEKARAVLVIWTVVSIGSEWVYSEAEYARVRGKLIPLRHTGLDHSAIPPPFNTFFTLDLGDRAGLRTALARLGVRPGLPA
jgi:hypothetical protein